MARAFGYVILAYLVAGAVALAVGWSMRADHPLLVALVADAAATVAVFAFSYAFDNSSFYDPYWSVAPVPIAVYWMLASETEGVSGLRRVLVLALMTLWAARLTWNWARGWEGLRHEDWRYVSYREPSGRAYWLVSFGGFHLVPTIIVFVGCLPLFPALATGTAPFGVLDGVAALVTAGAIAIEAAADRQLRRFRHSRRAPEEILRTGLWSWSRHPNYFGEMGFWWGLYLFGLAAAPAWGWTIVGPLTITLMFRFISLPMIERRMLERRPGFAAHQRTTSMVIPWPVRTRES